uniref:Uncharacterized protein n=1 Tax=Arundo donax TaxID=35708 RepID=A0A0A9AA64_ARUDO
MIRKLCFNAMFDLGFCLLLLVNCSIVAMYDVLLCRTHELVRAKGSFQNAFQHRYWLRPFFATKLMGLHTTTESVLILPCPSLFP